MLRGPEMLQVDTMMGKGTTDVECGGSGGRWRRL